VAEPRFPPIAELIPHAGDMVLLSCVVAHDELETRCRVEVAEQRLFCDAGGAVPAWLAIEWMAQCIAVRGGLRARERGEAPPLGLLLGSRKMRFEAADFQADQVLAVRARHLRGRPESGAQVFDCAIHELAPDGARRGYAGTPDGARRGYAGAPCGSRRGYAGAPCGALLVEGELSVVLPDDLAPFAMQPEAKPGENGEERG
jgi:predicted hotdog family 3-hydroxylacyl-ACP dehydratase